MNEHVAAFVEVAKAFYGFALIVLGSAFLLVTPIMLRVIRGLTTAVTLHAHALENNVTDKSQLDVIASDVATVKADVATIRADVAELKKAA